MLLGVGLLLARHNPVLHVMGVGLQLTQAACLTGRPLADVVYGSLHTGHVPPPQPIQPALSPYVALTRDPDALEHVSCRYDTIQTC